MICYLHRNVSCRGGGSDKYFVVATGAELFPFAVSPLVMGYNAELQLLLLKHRVKIYCREGTKSVGGRGGVNGVDVGGAADAASERACHN